MHEILFNMNNSTATNNIPCAVAQQNVKEVMNLMFPNFDIAIKSSNQFSNNSNDSRQEDALNSMNPNSISNDNNNLSTNTISPANTTSPRILPSLSLSTASFVFLHKHLNKGEQMSDWTHRPLSETQLNYASLDAYVLLGKCD